MNNAQVSQSTARSDESHSAWLKAESGVSIRRLRRLGRPSAPECDYVTQAQIRATQLRTQRFVVFCVGLAVLVTGVCLLVRAIFLQSFSIKSTSMTPTLQPNDHVVVTKLAYGLQAPFMRKRFISWAAPQRGEVVVFHLGDDPATPRDESTRSMIKRVIGVGGDRVLIDGQKVTVNGVTLREPYARWVNSGESRTRSFTVPQGAIFVLGDNRDDSFDSRFWSEPFVDVSRVVGPVAAIY